jgi:hypothetical protein
MRCSFFRGSLDNGMSQRDIANFRSLIQISPSPSFSKRGDVVEDGEFVTASEKFLFLKGDNKGIKFF